MVSIVVPVYNGEAYLLRCIESLINQTEKSIEILIVNDGSTDNSLRIAQQLAQTDSRIKVFTQENKGVSKARNLGIEKASGMYIGFVDCDDYAEPNMIEDMLAIAADRGLVVSNFVQNHSSEKILTDMPDAPLLSLNEQLAENYFTGTLGKMISFSVWNKLFSLDLIQCNQIRFPEGVQIGEDMIFVFRYLQCCEQIRFIDKGLYHYCISNASVMNAVCKNYLPGYCDTLRALVNMLAGSETVSDRVLSNWALEVFTYIFTNEYVKRMSFREFAVYYKEVRKSELYQYASRSERKDNFKRMMIRLGFRLKSKALLFALVKLNSLTLKK